MKDEILKPLMDTDAVAVPRYDIIDPAGIILHKNVDLRLKNEVVQEGTPLNKQNLMSDEAAAAVGLTTDATPSKAFEAIGASLSGLAADVSNLDADVDNLQYSNAGAHNAIYRGKFLGNSVTAAQYAAIKAGTFDDLYIGDYWTIGDVNYRISAFDYFLNAGDTECTDHHAVIVPDTCLYNAKMNTSNVTTGGYVGSAMRKSSLAQAKTTIKVAFGSAHVLTKRELLTNAVNGNTPSGWAWVDSDVELMNEVQVYGSVAWGAHDGKGSNVASGDGRFPLFMFDRAKLHNRENYWLRDVVLSTDFSFVDDRGFAAANSASSSYGVRPYFCIY